MGDDGGLHNPLTRPLWWGRGRLVLPIFEESMSTLSRGRSEHPAEKKTTNCGAFSPSSTRKKRQKHIITPDAQCMVYLPTFEGRLEV